MSLFKLTLKSILNRKLISTLLILSIGLSTMLLIGVQKIKLSAKESFSNSISGTDLIIGTRSGDIQLLLYTVFRQGQPVANISWASVTAIKNFPETAWLVPLSLGDSHRGYPVLATSSDYFKYYRYGKKKQLSFQTGIPFGHTFDIVLGSEVAKKLNYKLNDTIYLSHGVAKGNLPLHKNKPFHIVGILKPTGTPVDKTVHITLEGMTALHVDWVNGYAPSKATRLSISDLNEIDLSPHSVTGCLLGLKSKFSIFSVQRRITDWNSEPLMAIIPGVALSRLWSSISMVDTAFLVITILVTIIAFIGLLLALFMSLHQRKKELAILRIMGAHPSQLFLLLTLESLLITVSGVVFGLLLMQFLGIILKPFLEDKLGLILSLNTLSEAEVYLAMGIVVFGLVTSFIPAILSYRKSLSEGFISL